MRNPSIPSNPLEIIFKHDDPSRAVPSMGDRPVAYVLAEWAYANVADYEIARQVREYLAKWPDGPQMTMLPIDRAAAILGLTSQALLVAIKSGRLRGVWIGRAWHIPFEEVKNYKTSPQGRPKKNNS